MFYLNCNAIVLLSRISQTLALLALWDQANMQVPPCAQSSQSPLTCSGLNSSSQLWSVFHYPRDYTDVDVDVQGVPKKVTTVKTNKKPNRNRWILSMSAEFWEICWSLSFWVQFSFVLGGVVRVLIFCIGQLLVVEADMQKRKNQH